LDRLWGATPHPMPHADRAPAPHGLDHLPIEQSGPGQPARLGGWPCA
jgi:hypothetical protein